MDPEATLERLIEAGVLVETDDGGSITLDPGFVETRTHYLEVASDLDDEALERTLASDVDGSARLPNDRRERVEMLASCLAVGDHVEDLPDAHRLQLLSVLDGFSDPHPRDEGAPEAFVAVTGDQLKSFLRTSKRAVVYVWRDDCPPCEVTAEDLSELFPDSPDDLALLAVFGPDYPDVMDAFGVVGAPTILFVLDGAVDARLQGPQYPEVIENEVETLRELG